MLTIQQEAPDIPRLRAERGLTQTQLATRANCSRTSVALLEAGYVPRRSEVLPRIIAVLTSDEDAS